MFAFCLSWYFPSKFKFKNFKKCAESYLEQETNKVAEQYCVLQGEILRPRPRLRLQFAEPPYW